MLLTPLHQWWRKAHSFALEVHLGAAAVAAHRDAITEAWTQWSSAGSPPAQPWFSQQRDSPGARVRLVYSAARHILGLQAFSSTYFRFLPLHFSADPQSETFQGVCLTPVTWLGSQTPALEGCCIKYFTVMCKWGMQERWPGSQDFIFLHGNGSMEMVSQW